MKKKLIFSIVLCMLAIFAFSFAVSAEDAVCEHQYDGWTVALGENGFLGEITATAKCSDCGEAATEIIPKIFITKGYSNSSDGIMQDYGVNREALAKYEQLSGETVKFGAVVALKDSIGNVNPLDSKGEPISSKVKSLDYTDTEYSVISVSIKGIPENVKESSGLICALYVNAGGRTTYLDNCAEKVSCGAKTFTEIEAVPEKDTAKLDKVEVIDGTRYHQMTIEEMGLVARKYWNNTSSYNSDDTSKKFFATKSLTSEDLPNGTIIYIENTEWQYRPHKYHSGERGRPSTTKDEYTVIDDSWWADLDGSGTYTNVGFNISYYKNSSATNDINKLPSIYEAYTVEDIAAIFKIFVPVTYTEDNTGDNEGGEDVGGSGNEGGTTTPDQGGNEGGNEGGDVVVPELPDYSAEKQNWQDDGALKILAIGNSFSDDAMEYVYQVAKDAGVENIKLGNMYIGGCSLATHLSNAKNNSGAYTYRTNTNGTWSSVNSVSIKTAVESDDWDFITFQQVSGYSGIADSYDDLYELIKIVEPLNPSARLAWHMTWAYKTGSGHADFAKYNRDQMTMYNAIVDAVNSKILTIDNIEVVIPSGTAVQNVRTSFIGDTTRDGYHLSYGIGRYIAAMTYVKALTGLSIDNSMICPSDVDAGELRAIIECVNNAYKTPFAVTQSAYEERPVEPTPDPDEPSDILDGLVRVEYLDWVAGGYWNSSDASQLNFVITGASNSPNFWATRLFTKEQLPVGSVIVVESGWQYRPDGWVDLNTKNNNRPNNVSTYCVVIDEAWWGNYTVRGFNISNRSTSNIMSKTEDEINAIFKIYVPESAADANKAPVVEEPEAPVTPELPNVMVSSNDCVSEITVINGKEYRALTLEAMGLIQRAYYYSTSNTKSSLTTTDDTSKNFYATKIFEKNLIVDGAVIYIGSGWQYRPEGWQELDKKNSSSRPGNVKTTYVTVDEAWWGTYNYRGFNISKTSGNIMSTTPEQIYEIFKIYIPVENIAD
ncbi:MAG: DUF4886 domain-containing protein [Clostridia bacterium]|nr:DUF4886 domain-containing protein [Clostridia bacterium]